MNNHIQEQQKQMPKIELITFDLDDTFWEHQECNYCSGKKL